MKTTFTILAFAILMIFASCTTSTESAESTESATCDYYQLQVCTLDSLNQGPALEDYLENSYLPALHKAGIDQVGVFKTIEGLNGSQNLITVLIPFTSLRQFEKLATSLGNDMEYSNSSSDYFNLAHDNPPYQRMESSLMKAFSSAPNYHKPEIETANSERVYELRSYQSSTEKLHKRKVEMFNSGETELFVELGFEPMFFAKVISGAKMPNLMYMTCHANAKAQSTNWDAFKIHPIWTNLKGMEKYKHTVSHIDKWMMYPTEYSDL